MKNPKIYKIISALFALLLMAGDLTATLPASANKDIFIIACMLGTVGASAFETYFNPVLSNKILWMQIIGALGFAAGGVLDHLHVFQNGQIWSTNAGTMFTHYRASQAGTFGVNGSGNLEIGCNSVGSGTQIVIESGKQVGIGTTNPSDNALLTLESTTKGSLKIVGMNVTQAGAWVKL